MAKRGSILLSSSILILAVSMGSATTTAVGFSSPSTTPSPFSQIFKCQVVQPAGDNQMFIFTQVVDHSMPSVAYKITGAEYVERDINGALKNFAYYYVDVPHNTTASQSNEVSVCNFTSGVTPSGVMWWVAQRPTQRGFPTVGQDVIVNSTNGALQEDQYVSATFSGTGDETPPACTVSSGTQLRHAIYTLFVDPAVSGRTFSIVGAQLVTRTVKGVQQTWVYIHIDTSTLMRYSTSNTVKSCPVSISPETAIIDWALTSPPPPTGNYEAYCTVGGNLAKSSTAGVIVVDQYMNDTCQI